MKTRGNAYLLRTTILTGALAALALPLSASAQDQKDTIVGGQVAQAATTEAAPAEPATTESEAEETKVEEIVVTGSRLRRSEFNTVSPVQIITSEVSTQAGLISSAEILQGSSAAAGSTQLNGLFSGFVTDGGPGIQSVSLRGLGANRTLVLLNGRRLAPAGAGGTVGAGTDLNVLPSSVISRYEVLKDGASSVYGSDAVAGVINAVTRTNLDGIEVGASVNLPAQKGGEEYLADFAWGKTFDRGNILVAGEYTKQEPVRVKDRDWADCGTQLFTNPQTGQRVDRIDPATGQPKCYGQGLIYGVVSTPFNIPNTTAYPGFVMRSYDYITPDPNFANSLIPGWRPLLWRFNPAYNPATGLVTGANSPDERLFLPAQELNSTLIFPAERYSLVAFGNYDLDGGIELFSELLYNRRESSQAFAGQFFPVIGPDNPLNPVGDFGAFVQPIAPLFYENDQEVEYYRGVVGARGDFGGAGYFGGWNWEGSYMYSLSQARYGGNRLLADQVANALDITLDGNGNPICASATARAAGCVAINPFDPALLVRGEWTPAQLAYLWSNERGSTDFSSHLINGFVSGDLFQLPTGAVAAALGVEARWDEIDDLPGENTRNRNIFGFSTSGATAGKENVMEAFAELEAPILSKHPLAEEVRLNGSVRYTKYDKTGYDDATYKIGLDWALTNQVRFRSTYGTSFRGPALYELFLGGQTGFFSGRDPCTDYGQDRSPGNPLFDNCASEGLPPDWNGFPSTPEVITFGNDDGRLSAETSTAFSAGVVLTPEFADLSIAVDFFRIEVKDQVGRIGAAGILAACYGDDDFRAPGTFCDFVSQRTPYDPVNMIGGEIELINNSYFNINSQVTAGVDVTARYVKELDFGTISIDGDATWTTQDRVNLFGGNTTDNNGTIGDPKFVGQVDVEFERGDWSIFWRMDYTAKTDDYRFFNAPNDNPATTIRDFTAEETYIHAVSVSYETDEWEVTGGISNIFDQNPPTVSWDLTRPAGDAAFATQNDFFGRTFFLTVRRGFY